MISLLVCIVALFILYVNYHFRPKTREKIEQDVIKKGGKVISLHYEPSFSRRWSSKYVLRYYDNKNIIHESTLAVSAFSYFIDKDKIIKESDLPKEKTEKERSEFIPKYFKTFSTEDGELTTRQLKSDLEVGDHVLLNNKPAPDGRYKIGFLYYIYIKNGKVS